MAKSILIVIALMICWAVDIRSEDAETAWEHHQAHFPVKAASPAEREKRRSLFIAAHDFIESHNKKNLAFKLAHNQFSTMTKEEREKYLGLRRDEVPSHSRDTFVITEQKDNSRALPTSVDLRDHKCMNSVKHQGACGACWAFSTTAPIEFGTCLRNSGTKVALSEQMIVDCAPGYGCSGGHYYTAYYHLSYPPGQATSASYPYTGKQADYCKYREFSAVSGAQIRGYGTYRAGDVTSMMTALSQNQLLSVSFNAPPAFYYYRSGVLTDNTCKPYRESHAVVIVGYGVLNGLDHWIIRNSWGSSWGDSGYFLMKRGVNLCGIEGEPAFPKF